MAGEYPQMSEPQGADYGFLGGMFSAKQQQDAEAARLLSRQNQEIANQQATSNLDRYNQETPDFLRKLKGEADVKSVEGEVATRTKQQQVDAKVSMLLKDKSEAETAKILADNESQIQKLIAAKARYTQALKLGQGPQAAQKIAEEFGYDFNNPQVAATMGKIINDPNQVIGIIDHTLDASKKAQLSVSKHVQDMAQQQTVNDTNIKTSQIGAGATIEAAKINAASREAVQGMKNDSPQKPLSQSQALAKAATIASDPNVSPAERHIASNLLTELRVTELSKNPNASKSGIDIGAMSKVKMTPSAIASLKALGIQVDSTTNETTAPQTKVVGGVKYEKVTGGWQPIKE